MIKCYKNEYTEFGVGPGCFVNGPHVTVKGGRIKHTSVLLIVLQIKEKLRLPQH